jgi:hypothetical protein
VRKFNWKVYLVSTRTGNTPVAKAQRQDEGDMLYIEDPLHVVHPNKNPNLAHRITGEQWINIIICMENMERHMHEALTISGPPIDNFLGSQHISQMFKVRDDELGNRFSEQTYETSNKTSAVATVGEVAQPSPFSGVHWRTQTHQKSSPFSQFGLNTNNAGVTAVGESFHNNLTTETCPQPSPFSAGAQSQFCPGVTAGETNEQTLNRMPKATPKFIKAQPWTESYVSYDVLNYSYGIQGHSKETTTRNLTQFCH